MQTIEINQIFESLGLNGAQKIIFEPDQAAKILLRGTWRTSNFVSSQAWLQSVGLNQSGSHQCFFEGTSYRVQIEITGAGVRVSIEQNTAFLESAKSGDHLRGAIGAGVNMPGEISPSVQSEGAVSQFKAVSGGRGGQNVAARAHELKNMPLPVALPTAPVPAAPPPAPPQEEKWFHGLNGKQTGPMSRASIESLINSGIIKADTQIWREGMSKWVAAGKSEFALLFRTAQPVSRGKKVPMSDANEDKYWRERFGMNHRALSAGEKAEGMGWGLLAAGLALCLLAPATIGGLRMWNATRDQSELLSPSVLAKNKESRDLKLALIDEKRGDTFNEDGTVSIGTYDSYGGRFRYGDGDVGEVDVTITGRDWLNRPASWEIEHKPVDFSPQLSGDIAAQINARVQHAYSSVFAAVSLRRQTRDHYTGTAELRERFQDRRGNRYVRTIRSNPLQVKISNFNADGSPGDFTWSGF